MSQRGRIGDELFLGLEVDIFIDVSGGELGLGGRGTRREDGRSAGSFLLFLSHIAAAGDIFVLDL